MIELRLTYDGGGRFSTASHADWKDACDEFEQGEQLVAHLVRPRSSPENRLVHGAIKSAYDNQRGGPMFTEEEGGWLKLRAWLLCEAGHCTTIEFEPGTLTESAVIMLKRRDREEGVHSFWTQKRSSRAFTCKTPKTIRYAVVKHPDFQPVKTKVLEMLCNVICPGTTPEQLMEIRHVRGRPKTAAKIEEREHCPAET